MKLISGSIVKIMMGLFILIAGIQSVHAAVLDSYSVSPAKIFKCQNTVILANYSSYADINTLTARLLERDGSYTIVSMTALGSGNYSGNYGNDNTAKWGNKSITFRVTKADTSTYDNSTNAYIFIYSDPCTGTNIQGYQNTTYRTSGFGNYTRPLFTGEKNLVEFSLAPYLDYWGFMIYLIILTSICFIIYIKNQSVMQPIIIAFIGIAGLVSSGVMPAEYKNYIMLFMAAAMAAIFWRLFKSA